METKILETESSALDATDEDAAAIADEVVAKDVLMSRAAAARSAEELHDAEERLLLTLDTLHDRLRTAWRWDAARFSSQLAALLIFNVAWASRTGPLQRLAYVVFLGSIVVTFLAQRAQKRSFIAEASVRRAYLDISGRHVAALQALARLANVDLVPSKDDADEGAESDEREIASEGSTDRDVAARTASGEAVHDEG